MLTSENKKKIDSLRDTLVGTIPVPTEQVKQITLGLIYKFMSDIDEENQGLGGKSFFAGEYEQYSWSHIMDRSLSSHDRASLYAEGLDKMSLNPNIPQLFRNIFKGAFLPFRNAELIEHFLRGIAEFEYEHSEDLGDAFEYLLSIMGSQGDAGQFRTPRHIIDFIVETVDPEKTDTILDPACGTAGFLISTYKHILKNNVDPKIGVSGSGLTPTEKKKLSINFVGYDISHDMQRISLVNMYLHEFSEPKIFEYDTLTSLDRWEENFDCILANPPFMTPKGGIKPHNRFSIKAKRSEILFVDYILEHLNPNGKAGIIVPDGIVANSPNAYKRLRKMMLENNSLYAIVSLPAGVFSPYSDVKTSILMIDKNIAKRTDKILFIEVKADGYDLGSTRRKIDKNDLPGAKKLILSFKKNALEKGESITIEGEDSVLAHLVARKEILDSPSISLSGKRYKDDIHIKSEWDVLQLGDFLEESKIRVNKEAIEVWSVSNKYGFIPSDQYFGKQVASADINKYKKIFPNYFAYNPARINVGSIALNEGNSIGCVSPMYVIFKIKEEKQNVLLPKYLLLLLKSKMGIKQILKYSDGAVRKILSFANLALIKIPVPPKEEQNKILTHFKQIRKYETSIKEEDSLIRIGIEKSWGIKEDEVDFEGYEFNPDAGDEENIDEEE